MGQTLSATPPQGLTAGSVPSGAFPLLAPDGTSAAPSYSFLTNPDFGIYSRFTDIISFSRGSGLTIAELVLTAGSPAFTMASDGFIGFLDATTLEGATGYDVRLYRDATAVCALKKDDVAQTFRVYGATTGTKYSYLTHDATNAVLGTSSGFIKFSPALAANGQTTNVKVATASVSTPSGTTATATNLIPAGCFLIGVTVRVTTTVTGATSFLVGDAGDPNRWGNNIAVTLNTTTTIADYTANGYGQYTAADSVVLTRVASDFTGGAVRVTAYYLDLTPAVS